MNTSLIIPRWLAARFSKRGEPSALPPPAFASGARVDHIRVREGGALEQKRRAQLGREGVTEDVPVVEPRRVPAAAAEVAVRLTRTTRLAGRDGLDHDLEQLEQFVEPA